MAHEQGLERVRHGDPAAEAAPPVLQQAAHILDRQADEIARRWDVRVRGSVYAGRRDLVPGEVYDNLRSVVRGVAEALRAAACRKPEPTPTAWSAFSATWCRMRSSTRPPGARPRWWCGSGAASCWPR